MIRQTRPSRIACEELGSGGGDGHYDDLIDTSDTGTTSDAYEYQYSTTTLFESGGPEYGTLCPPCRAAAPRGGLPATAVARPPLQLCEQPRQGQV